MRISFHAWLAYKECPKKCHLQYVRKAPPTVPLNDYHTLYGNLVGKFFELYCNEWRYKTPYIFPEIVEERLHILIKGILLTTDVDFTAPGCTKSKEEIIKEAAVDINRIFDTETLNYFLNTRAEVEIQLTLKTGDLLNGRLDFIHNNLDDTVVIIDGKGGKTKGKNVTERQLLFYALLYTLHHKRMPDQLGFFYYRYNCFEPIVFNEKILNDFRAEVAQDVKDLNERPTNATPSAKSCQYCKYLIGCIEGTEAKVKRSRGSRVKLEGDGLIEFGLGE